MKWKDFLNPRSMLTPGIAGSVVMVIANTLWVEFMIPQKWSALLLSFLLIIPILVQFSATLIENVVYFLFNGLIIFALAVNSNFAGRKIHEIVTNPKSVAYFKSSSPSEFLSADEIKVMKVKGVQLALNSKHNTSTYGIYASDDTLQKDSLLAQNDNKDSEEKAKEQEDKSKSKNKEDRDFFQPWF